MRYNKAIPKELLAEILSIAQHGVPCVLKKTEETGQVKDCGSP